jgi:endonuclease/exonuclease/phosphatase family metal-dependent hydrolase
VEEEKKDLVIATFNLENLEKDDNWKARKRVLQPMLKRINADILFLQEVHSIDDLEELIKGTIYEGRPLKHTTRKSDGKPYALRNLVIISRFEITNTTPYHHTLVEKPKWQIFTAKPAKTEPSELSWERPILHCELQLGNDKILHAINLHLKSKNPVDIEGQKKSRYEWETHGGWAEGYFLSSIKRVGQALETRLLLDDLLKDDSLEEKPPETLVAVAGDFNADIGSVPFKILVGSVQDTNNPDLQPTMMIPCEYNVPSEQRFSLIYRGKGEMLDHVIVSQAFYQYWVGTDIFNELLPDESIAFATDPKFPESDHAPVVARFRVPVTWIP